MRDSSHAVMCCSMNGWLHVQCFNIQTSSLPFYQYVQPASICDLAGFSSGSFYFYTHSLYHHWGPSCMSVTNLFIYFLFLTSILNVAIKHAIDPWKYIYQYFPPVVSWLEFILCECEIFFWLFSFPDMCALYSLLFTLIKLLYLPLVVSWLKFIVCECIFFLLAVFLFWHMCALPLIKLLYLPPVVCWLEFIPCKFFFFGCFPFLMCACFTACCLALIKFMYLLAMGCPLNPCLHIPYEMCLQLACT